ncbi:MAG: triple tyrosine motif-containing protein [Saprospiraceae bacterium]
MMCKILVKKSLRLVTFLLLSGRLTPFFAQDLSISFHHIALEQGLSHGQHYFTFQDSYGFIWISTDEGLNRFDGKNIEHLTFDAAKPSAPASEKVSSPCFEDHHKNIWFTTFSGVGCYRRGTGQFEFFTTENLDLKDYYAFYLDSDQHLWVKAGIGEQSGIFRMDTRNGQFQPVGKLKGERIAVVLDTHGKVKQLVASMLPDKKPGLTLTELSTWKTSTIEFGLMSNGQTRRSSPVKNVLVEGDSIIWAALYDGLGQYNIRTDKAISILERGGNVSREFGWTYDMVAYDATRLFVGCSEGLLVFDKQKKRFNQQFRHHNQLKGSLRAGEITSLHRDPSDNLWLSIPGNAISFAHLFKNKFSVISETVGRPIVSMFEDNLQRIWCSTQDSGAYIFDHNGRLVLHTNELRNKVQPKVKFSLFPISTFWQDRALGLWGISDTYMFYWNEISGVFEFREENAFGVPSTASDLLKAYCLLADGTQLIAQGDSIFRIQTSGKKVNLQSIPAFRSLGLQQVTAIFQNRKGQLFLADNQFRIVVLDWNNRNPTIISEIKGIASFNVFAETADSQVWAATSKGLFRINPSTSKGVLLMEKAEGCPSEPFYNILQDKEGNLWLTGNNGLVRFNPFQKTFHRFGIADGLLSNQFSSNSVMRVTETGEFWLGGKNGVNICRPAEVKLLESRPKVQLTKLLINDTAFHISMDLSELEHLDLNYTQNTLSFQFAALDFSAPGTNQYYYRMKGIEKDTVSNGAIGLVRYANLPPGTYTFEVWAINSDGVLSPEPRRVSLTIHPPFYKTWWFYLLCTLSLGGIIYGWFWYRLQQALKIERMRVEISSDLHDDVGTLLAGLAMQSEALELTAPEKDKSKLKRISEISRNAMAHMRDTVWAIDARKDKLENLLDRMREHAEETLTPRDIRFDIQTDHLSLKQNLPTNIRQNIYLIYKEAITNAAKHTNGDMVTVSLKKKGTGFEMRICDNGKVEDKGYKTTGLGTSNMQMRAGKIGGKLEITGEGGFCVVLHMGGLG